jgi:hypothetical protein
MPDRRRDAHVVRMRGNARAAMSWRSAVMLLAGVLCAGLPFAIRAADMANATFTALKTAPCVTDASTSFFAQDLEPPANPALPTDRFFMVARYMGRDAVASAPPFDFARFPDDYGWSPLRGTVVTGLSVPDPKPIWQRASRADATVDNASAFQLHCFDAGSFINTWTFPVETIVGGGPHAIYGYTFDNPPPPAVFDADPQTDFVLQAAVEIPWFAQWPDLSDQALYAPVGQVSFFAYFRDRVTDKSFALLLALFDNRAATNGSYAPFVAHDTSTPFVSTPLNSMAAYASVSPYSATYTGTPWTGLRFFRGHVSQANFRQALADINVFCMANQADHYCDTAASLGTAFSGNPANYELTDFGVLHELFRGGPMGNLSMGVHVSGFGAWNAR